MTLSPDPVWGYGIVLWSCYSLLCSFSSSPRYFPLVWFFASAKLGIKITGFACLFLGTVLVQGQSLSLLPICTPSSTTWCWYWLYPSGMAVITSSIANKFLHSFQIGDRIFCFSTFTQKPIMDYISINLAIKENNFLLYLNWSLPLKMNAFVVFSIWIVCVFCTIIVAPINVNVSLNAICTWVQCTLKPRFCKKTVPLPWEPETAGFLSWDFQLYLYLKY